MNHLSTKSSLIGFTIIILFGVLVQSAYGEVVSIKPDKKIYVRGDLIMLNGTVNEINDKVVSILITDPNDRFTLVKQTMVQPDNTFQFSLKTFDPKTGEDNNFYNNGFYKVIATTTTFDKGVQTKLQFFYDAADKYESYGYLNDYLIVDGVNVTEKLLKEQEERIPHYFSVRPEGTYKDGILIPTKLQTNDISANEEMEKAMNEESQFNYEDIKIIQSENSNKTESSSNHSLVSFLIIVVSGSMIILVLLSKFRIKLRRRL